MKRGWIVTSGVVAGVAAASLGYVLLQPKPTPDEVKNPVDVQYEQLSIYLNDLEAKVQQPDANVDSLAALLQDVRWKPVEQGGEYEQQKRNLYLDTKKNVALTFRSVMQDLQQEVAGTIFDDVEAISE